MNNPVHTLTPEKSSIGANSYQQELEKQQISLGEFFEKSKARLDSFVAEWRFHHAPDEIHLSEGAWLLLFNQHFRKYS